MSSMDFLKGLGVGMAAGAAIGMVLAPGKPKKNSLAGRMLKTAGEVVEGISEAMGL